MGDRTKIGWCDHTHNAWWGCDDAPADEIPVEGRTSPECARCYARTFDHRLGGDHWGKAAPRRFFGDAYWAKPLRWNAEAQKRGERASVFCSSMSDIGERHPDPEILRQQDVARARLWALIRDTPWLDWLLLTKRIDALAEMLPCINDPSRACDPREPWPNVFVGVTCGVRSSLWRVRKLRLVPAAVRFVSCEPILEHITAADWDDVLPGIDQLIIGDESGHGRRPGQLDWVRTAREAAVRNRVAFYFKQWNASGKTVHLPVIDGRIHSARPNSRP